jgi:hypothetical protein
LNSELRSFPVVCTLTEERFRVKILVPRELRLPRPLLRKFTFAELLLCAFLLGFLYKDLRISFKPYVIHSTPEVTVIAD